MDKEQLKQYRYIAGEVAELQAEYDAILQTALGATTYDGMPKAPGFVGDRTGNVAIKRDKVLEKLNHTIENLDELRIEIEDAISQISNPAYRQLLRLRYIEGKRWEFIAIEMDYDYRWVLRLHGRALEELRKIAK